jgi:nicotinamide-nucleotide amidase
MTAGVLCIGTEITRGEIVNTNATWLADRLTTVGFEVTEVVSVDDDRKRLVATLRRMTSVHRVVVCTGGLGPTSDDLTAEGAALATGLPLVRDPASVEAIADRFRRMNRVMSATNRKQADFPSGATVMPNAVGTAPGFWMAWNGAQVFFFPGVPREMRHLWETHAESVVQAIAPNDTYQLRLRTFGQPESAVGAMLDGVEHQFPGVTIGYRASFPEIEVKVFAKSRDFARAKALSEEAAEEVRRRLGDIVYGEGTTTFVSVVADAIRGRGYKLALAESCTGGLVAQMLTSESASDYLVAGLVTYANEAKVALLGVPSPMIEEHGAVSEAVARAMAQGAARSVGVELGVGITGIAGPTGGTTDKPVGLVHIAVAHPGGVVARHHVFPGDRARVQRFAAYAALLLVRDCCSSDPPVR